MTDKTSNKGHPAEATRRQHAAGKSMPGKISLSIPPFRQGSKKKKFGDTIPVKRWHGLHAHPEALLKDVAAFLRPTNREKADTLDRVYLAETALQTVSSSVNKIYNTYLSTDEFPESESQRDLLNCAIDAVHQITVAYKHIFKAEHESFNSPMKLIHDRVRHAGFRIIELTQIEQRLLAASYQKLPNLAWKDLNQVFFVFWYYNDYNTPRDLSGCLNINTGNSKVSFTGNQPKSPLQLFISTQLFGLADGSSIPNKALHIIDAYLSMIEYDINVIEYNENDILDGMLTISCNQSHPPQLKTQNVEIPAVQIDLFDLWRQIKKDAEALEHINKGIEEKISPALATLDASDRIPLVDALLSKLRHYSRKSIRKSAGQQVAMSIYLGFANTHKAISSMAGTDTTKNESLKLMHSLAKASASLSVETDRGRDESWYLVDESDGGLRLQTQTSSYTKKINVGQVVAFNNTAADSQALGLGYVTRINRLNETDIEISIVKICSRPQAVVVQDKNRQGKDAAMVAFLVTKENTAKQLMLPNAWPVKQRQSLTLVYRNHQHTIVLTKPVLQQRDFSVYDIAAQT